VFFPQALLAKSECVLALEPEWEMRFEPHSYGYRPGRGVHDAIAAILVAIERRPTFVYRSDIEGAFDHIDQSALLDKLETSPLIEHAIRGWFKAGIMDNGVFVPGEVGVAQGGVLSPLLMNITLHGMEEVVAGGKVSAYGRELPLLVRYGDDFVILHADLQELQRAEKRVQRWLTTLGLQLHGQKTRISHTFTPFQGEVGFDFLGFHIYQAQGEATRGLKTIIDPGKEAIQRHNAAIEQKLRHLQNASQAQVIQELNPLIIGWTSYYNGLVEAASMSQYDELMEQRLLNWASKRHPGQARDWLLARYWRPAGKHERVFASHEGPQLRVYRQASILKGSQ
jgi:RNA-directed DNA polymerase